MDKYDDVVIADLSAQVARLEAANAAAAKIVSILKANGMNLGVVQVPPVIQDTDRLYALKDAVATFDAALSSDAGKGWVSPEVREQVREALKQAQCELWGIEPVKPYCTIAQIQAAQASLDALKGVE